MFIYLQGYVYSIVKYSDEEFVKIATAMAVGYFCKGFVWNAWLGSECVWNLFLLSFFINYSRITLSLYSFTFLFINLCVCFKSVYTGRFLLLFPCVSMFYHFCCLTWIPYTCIWYFCISLNWWLFNWYLIYLSQHTLIQIVCLS